MEHKSVMVNELVESMNVVPNGYYVDCTGGGGGHANALLSKMGSSGHILLLDRDLEAIGRLRERFAGDRRVEVVHANFADIDEVFSSLKLEPADGIYADFGVSLYQLKSSKRGFSFREDGPLDMRMDNTNVETVADIVNDYSEDNLANIIFKFGEERFAPRIARAIVQRRVYKSFSSTIDFANVVKSAIPKKFHKPGVHPATKTFQAFRIYVNKELDAVAKLMNKIEPLIKEGGHFAAISFHSLEDKIVKDSLNKYAKPCTCPPEFPKCVCGAKPSFLVLTKKPLVPTMKEVQENPLSRSAKMRVAEKL